MKLPLNEAIHVNFYLVISAIEKFMLWIVKKIFSLQIDIKRVLILFTNTLYSFFYPLLLRPPLFEIRIFKE